MNIPYYMYKTNEGYGEWVIFVNCKFLEWPEGKIKKQHSEHDFSYEHRTFEKKYMVFIGIINLQEDVDIKIFGCDK